MPKFGKPVLTCHLCKRTFCQITRLKKHIEAHLNNGDCLMTCDYCEQTFEHKRNLQIHILKEHLDIQHRCDKCRRLFTSEEKLNIHRCKSKMICQDCGKIFKHIYVYRKHCLTHSKTVLRCKFCYAIFVKNESYETHMAKLSCSKSARYNWLNNLNFKKCRTCEKVFGTEQELLEHFIVWHPGKPYKCYWCEHQWNASNDLKKHVHAHIIERYTCNECNKAYTSQEGFRKHKLKHQNAKFKCKYCEKEYLSWNRVKIHQELCKNTDKTNLPVKSSRQLNWESRIISKKVRMANDDVSEEPTINNTFLDDESDSLSDRQGWFDTYYNTQNDFIPRHEQPIVDNIDAISDSSSNSDSNVTEAKIDFDYKLCRLCGDEFTFEFELLHHFVKTHPGKIPHQCPHCDMQLPLFAQLKEHLKGHGIGEGVYHCGNCSKKFVSVYKCRRHETRCQGKNERFIKKTCRCGKVFQTRCGYKRHKTLKCQKNVVIDDKKTSIAVVEKPKSPEIVQDEPKMVETLPTSMCDKKYECRLCPMAFPFERGLVMHFKSHHPGIKPLICPQCGIELADKLKEHLKTHGIGEEFICELCNRRFNQKFMSKIHEMWHQGIEYKCKNCKQKFLTQDKMKRHVESAKCSNRMSLLKLPCDICGKSYRSKFGLKSHYLTHTPKESRPVKNRMNCEFCGKWFEQNNGLQRHRRIHTGEKPYCCRYCPKAFVQEGNCKAHERLHTGESKPRRKKQQDSNLHKS